MKEQTIPGIQLVFTTALKKEVPKDWLDHCRVPFFTCASLRSGAVKRLNHGHRGIMVVGTGPGLEAAGDAACWIRDHIRPFFVINIGTCGLADRGLPLGVWIRPGSVSNEDGDALELDTRFPIPLPDRLVPVHSLLSVEEPVLDISQRTWRDHDALDMECYAQAKIFRDAKISFSCLKFSTDYSDRSTPSDFNAHLPIFVHNVKKIMDFMRLSEEDLDITAIIPVYNRRQTVRRAIDSVLSQSYQPEEIIVVDDGSADGTPEILQGYGDRITSVLLQENRGAARARNIGVERARTEWIAFLDSDDSWKGDKLKKQVEYIRRFPFYEMIQSEEMWIRNGVRVNPRRHHAKPLGWIWERSLKRCLVSPSAVLVKRSLLEAYGKFDENLPVCEDYDLWLRISRHHPVGLEPGLSVIKYGGHEDQLSRKFFAMDKYRVISLARQLRNEPRDEYRSRIIHVLEKKLNILIQGYEKRQKMNDAREMRDILCSLDNIR
jgi:glycosyltransferase involved in cell wall biosynthesis